jgi:hypothetical protein
VLQSLGSNLSVVNETRHPRRFAFTVPLMKMGAGASHLYALEIPERVSVAVGRRGPVPILATLNKAVEVQASLVPTGGGRHRLQLNSRVRGELGIEPGSLVRVALHVPEKPPKLPQPAELVLALREADLQESFAQFPVGKQNHIVSWIEEAARPQTRQKRVEMAIQVAFRARERAYERQNASRRSRPTAGK